MLPRTASAMRIGRLALNDPWVKYRWNPAVMPSTDRV
jgi:hypothetical protein